MYLSASIAYTTFYLENPGESTEMPFLTQERPTGGPSSSLDVPGQILPDGESDLSRTRETPTCLCCALGLHGLCLAGISHNADGGGWSALMNAFACSFFF